MFVLQSCCLFWHGMAACQRSKEYADREKGIERGEVAAEQNMRAMSLLLPFWRQHAVFMLCIKVGATRAVVTKRPVYYYSGHIYAYLQSNVHPRVVVPTV